MVVKALQERLYADYGMQECIVLDQAGSLKGHVMDAYMEENDIIHEYISCDNHKANRLAETIIREFNDHMNLTCKDHWKIGT